MKRDDLSGSELCGNKVRKLEFIAAAALRDGCDTLVTEGTPQSNHCRATAAVCARLGLHCKLLLRPAPPPGPPQGNHLLDLLLGAETQQFPRPQFDEQRQQIVAVALESLRAAGRRPRWTPMGASEPLGCWGYISAAAELAEQLAGAGLREVDVVTACSSAGTYTGLLLGRLLHGLQHVTAWAVPVSDDLAHFRREIPRLAQATIAQFALPIAFDEADVRLIDGGVGEGYARPMPAANETLRLLARTEGILLDPVYTAKAFHCLLREVEAGRLGRSRPVVFLHTGGIFSDFAWPDVLLGDART